MPLTGLVIDADQNLTLRAPDLYGGALGGQHRFPIVRPAHKVTVLRILDDIPHMQDAGMIIKGHIQTGDLQTTSGDERKQAGPAQLGDGFKGTATLSGHLHPYAHILPAIVMHADAGKILPVTVAVCALNLLPWAA